MTTSPRVKNADKVCSVDQCEKPVRAKGFCRNHYQHNFTYGHPTEYPNANVELTFICKQCGTSFTRIYGKTGPKPFFCSNKCRWRNYNPEPVLPPPVCENCGSTFQRSKYGTQRKYCSIRCASKARYDAKKTVLPDRVCEYCNIAYTPLKQNQRWCSKECSTPGQVQVRTWVSIAVPHELPPCVECGKVRILPYNPGKRRVSKYCGQRCRYYGELRANGRLAESWPCWQCGTQIHAIRNDERKGHMQQRYCTVQCRWAASRDRQRALGTYDGKTWAHTAQRRAWKQNNGPHEYIDREAVFARDNWVCGICQQPVDPTLSCPDNMAASVDHIIPLSKGGTHIYANVQCAHLTCNLQKSDRLDP